MLLIKTQDIMPTPSFCGETGRSLAFYLAMEEHVAASLSRILPEGFTEAFFIWQVPPSVIFGHNQEMSAEVNVRYCEENGISMFRRKSGGGCVYADRGNIMLSAVSSETSVNLVFSRFLERLSLSLRQAGLPAVRSEHNDVLVDGRKVSGNACFLTKDASIVHGTLLYDVDLVEMARAITPSEEKLRSHGVRSVRARVANLKDIAGASAAVRDIEALKRHVLASFCPERQVYTLSGDDIDRIERLAEAYTDKSYITKK